MLEERARYDERLEADVLVIGAGVAGVCAAIQAARCGCDVILLEMDDVLGGNSGPNLGIHISGAHSFHPYANETGIIDELEERAAQHWAKIHTHTMHYNISRLWEAELYAALKEAGVRVFRRNYAREPLMDGQRIAAVIVEDLATYTARRIDVRHHVIEASGDGHIAQRAGAAYMRGREGAERFGERSAPAQGDDVTLGSSITALVRKADRPIPFFPPPDTPPFEPGYGYAGPDAAGSCLHAHAMWDPAADFCFLWHTETGGQLDTLADEHTIYDDLLRQLYSVWHHIKNEAHAEEARNWELVWVSPKAGRRESRRFIGDHILTQTEIEEAAAFEDGVAYGGYAIDIHNPTGTGNRQVDIVFCSIPPLYSIPYRCLYARDISNLFFAGRLISASHLAHGTTRLQRTLGTVGQAAGMAAGLCVRHGCTPRELYRQHLGELQQTLLKYDATLLGISNRDARDKARRATISATSEQRYGPERLSALLPLDRVRGVALWHWPSELHQVELYLQNNAPEPRALRLRLGVYQAPHKWKAHDQARAPIELASGNRADWGNMDHVAAFAPVAEARAIIPPDYEGWLRFGFEPPVQMMPHDPTSDEESYLLTLGPTRDVLWGYDASYYDYARRAELGDDAARYRLSRDTHLFRLSPRPPCGEATNVTNGWHRRLSTTPVNMWVSAQGAALPQSLTLTWDESEVFNCVHLTFDTLYRAYRDMPINREELGVAGMCVRDYDLQALRDDGWETIVRERGNVHRHRIHRLEARQETSALRLVVRATNEPGWPARVYEVRVYDEPEGAWSPAEPEA